jgi:hypothetical protein
MANVMSSDRTSDGHSIVKDDEMIECNAWPILGLRLTRQFKRGGGLNWRNSKDRAAHDH